MKKSLIALAAVAVSGAAFAQSSVTVFGVVDQAVTMVNGGTNWNGINSGGNQTSRLGFRGVEDLGNGLKANFWLEAGLLADQGTGNTTGETGLDFQRRSTVGLEGSFGEVRLGRDLTEAFKATSRYDVFGQVGLGVSRLWANNTLGNGVSSVALTSQRVSNMVTYVSPNISGFKAAVNYGFGEVQGENRDSRYVGAGLTYDNGPLSLGLSGERSNRGANSNVTSDVTAWALGGSYNLGVVKLAAAYRDSKAKILTGDKNKAKGYYFGVSAPVGAAGEVKASYNRYEGQIAGLDKHKADQFALGYVHNLSKRTAVYGTYAYIKNKDNGALDVNLNGTGTTGTLKDNGSQHGLQVGVRHAF
ncbi:porin [Comamonas jiangduensis]|uniref:porin n=1 Tax=Comamonas jiangduensis TaxID=1194168 RepID=UPI003BF7A30B